jgi:hypothetical protein
MTESKDREINQELWNQLKPRMESGNEEDKKQAVKIILMEFRHLPSDDVVRFLKEMAEPNQPESIRIFLAEYLLDTKNTHISFGLYSELLYKLVDDPSEKVKEIAKKSPLINLSERISASAIRMNEGFRALAEQAVRVSTGYQNIMRYQNIMSQYADRYSNIFKQLYNSVPVASIPIQKGKVPDSYINERINDRLVEIAALLDSMRRSEQEAKRARQWVENLTIILSIIALTGISATFSTWYFLKEDVAYAILTTALLPVIVAVIVVVFFILRRRKEDKKT